MKNLFLLLLLGLLSLNISAQESTLPKVMLKTLDGQSFNTSGISNDGKPIIISFWALWCKPCQKELDAFNESYEEWQKETGVKIYAVSIDDSRSTARVAPLVKGKGWEFEVLLDPNGDFKRAMNVNMIPHTFLLDGSGKIISQHTSYFEGAELELYEKVKKLAAKK
ncbi:MAG: alkyl hydroperoxide reductase/thiol specific antioxidant/Mal allergen [Bacteroidetes bacterium]|nr:MAG: alkyl hydroperoxide reductase/thiol specific antioxidant/Mal allergen [Bacteroidota bacterium]